MKIEEKRTWGSTILSVVSGGRTKDHAVKGDRVRTRKMRDMRQKHYKTFRERESFERTSADEESESEDENSLSTFNVDSDAESHSTRHVLADFHEGFICGTSATVAKRQREQSGIERNSRRGSNRRRYAEARKRGKIRGKEFRRRYSRREAHSDDEESYRSLRSHSATLLSTRAGSSSRDSYEYSQRSVFESHDLSNTSSCGSCTSGSDSDFTFDSFSSNDSASANKRNPLQEPDETIEIHEIEVSYTGVVSVIQLGGLETVIAQLVEDSRNDKSSFDDNIFSDNVDERPYALDCSCPNPTDDQGDNAKIQSKTVEDIVIGKQECRFPSTSSSKELFNLDPVGSSQGEIGKVETKEEPAIDLLSGNQAEGPSILAAKKTSEDKASIRRFSVEADADAFEIINCDEDDSSLSSQESASLQELASPDSNLCLDSNNHLSNDQDLFFVTETEGDIAFHAVSLEAAGHSDDMKHTIGDAKSEDASVSEDVPNLPDDFAGDGVNYIFDSKGVNNYIQRRKKGAATVQCKEVLQNADASPCIQQESLSSPEDAAVELFDKVEIVSANAAQEFGNSPLLPEASHFCTIGGDAVEDDDDECTQLIDEQLDGLLDTSSDDRLDDQEKKQLQGLSDEQLDKQSDDESVEHPDDRLDEHEKKQTPGLLDEQLDRNFDDESVKHSEKQSDDESVEYPDNGLDEHEKKQLQGLSDEQPDDQSDNESMRSDGHSDDESVEHHEQSDGQLADLSDDLSEGQSYAHSDDQSDEQVDELSDSKSNGQFDEQLKEMQFASTDCIERQAEHANKQDLTAIRSRNIKYEWTFGDYARLHGALKSNSRSKELLAADDMFCGDDASDEYDAGFEEDRGAGSFIESTDRSISIQQMQSYELSDSAQTGLVYQELLSQSSKVDNEDEDGDDGPFTAFVNGKLHVFFTDIQIGEPNHVKGEHSGNGTIHEEESIDKLFGQEIPVTIDTTFSVECAEVGDSHLSCQEDPCEMVLSDQIGTKQQLNLSEDIELLSENAMEGYDVGGSDDTPPNYACKATICLTEHNAALETHCVSDVALPSLCKFVKSESKEPEARFIWPPTKVCYKESEQNIFYFSSSGGYSSDAEQNEVEEDGRFIASAKPEKLAQDLSTTDKDNHKPSQRLKNEASGIQVSQRSMPTEEKREAMEVISHYELMNADSKCALNAFREKGQLPLIDQTSSSDDEKQRSEFIESEQRDDFDCEETRDKGGNQPKFSYASKLPRDLQLNLKICDFDSSVDFPFDEFDELPTAAHPVVHDTVQPVANSVVHGTVQRAAHPVVHGTVQPPEPVVKTKTRVEESSEKLKSGQLFSINAGFEGSSKGTVDDNSAAVDSVHLLSHKSLRNKLPKSCIKKSIEIMMRRKTDRLKAEHYKSLSGFHSPSSCATDTFDLRPIAELPDL